MKIFILECNESELRSNRTVMDSINDVLNNFVSNLVGVDNIDYAKAYAEALNNDEDEE